MPVTGSLDTSKFTKGRGLLYIQTGVPAADAALTLAAGVPASGHMVGYTTEGNNITWGREEEEVNADEASAAVETVIANETLTIAGTAYQLEDIVLLQALLGTGSYSDKTTYDLIKFGGLTDLTALGTIDGALLVWLKKNSTTQYVRFQIYDAVNQGDASMQVTRTAYGTMPYTLNARPVTSRAVGDQLGQWAIDKT